MKACPENSRSRWFAWPPSLLLLAAIMALLTGCSALLPTSKEETIVGWDQFDQAKAAYDKVTLGNSRDELKALGFDVVNSPNVEVLNYLEVAAKVQAIPLGELDPGLQQCLRSRHDCKAYVFDLRKLKTKRVGNFFADFFNFNRKTDSAGWRFKALLVMVNDQLTYKLWSGTPVIETYKEQKNPLGPLQGSGSSPSGILFWM